MAYFHGTLDPNSEYSSESKALPATTEQQCLFDEFSASLKTIMFSMKLTAPMLSRVYDVPKDNAYLVLILAFHDTDSAMSAIRSLSKTAASRVILRERHWKTFESKARKILVIKDVNDIRLSSLAFGTQMIEALLQSPAGGLVIHVDIGYNTNDDYYRITKVMGFGHKTIKDAMTEVDVGMGSYDISDLYKLWGVPDDWQSGLSMIKTVFDKHKKKCRHCGKTGDKFKQCSGCHMAHYCNVSCQKADWQTHALSCKTECFFTTRLAQYIDVSK